MFIFQILFRRWSADEDEQYEKVNAKIDGGSVVEGKHLLLLGKV